MKENKFYVTIDPHQGLTVRHAHILEEDDRNTEETVRVQIGPSLTFVNRESLCDIDEIPNKIREVLGVK